MGGGDQLGELAGGVVAGGVLLVHGAEGERHVAPVAALLRVVLVHREQLDHADAEGGEAVELADQGAIRARVIDGRRRPSPTHVHLVDDRRHGSTAAARARRRPRPSPSPAAPAPTFGDSALAGGAPLCSGGNTTSVANGSRSTLRRVEPRRRRRRRRGRTRVPVGDVADPLRRRRGRAGDAPARCCRRRRSGPASPTSASGAYTRTGCGAIGAARYRRTIAWVACDGVSAASLAAGVGRRRHGGVDGQRLPPRRGPGDGDLPGDDAAPAAAARGRGRRRQDRGGQGAGGVDRRRADPPAVLRGHRRRPGRLRLGLRPPAAPPAGRRDQRRGARPLAATTSRPTSTRALPHPPGAAALDRAGATARLRCC